MTKFKDMGLPEAIQRSLEQMQFEEATPIQAETIPLAIQGRDILGSAQTGTGKTAAFGIPLVSKLLSNEIGCALVMTPTRELASQVMSQLQAMLGKRSKINSALLIGGDSMRKQINQLDKQPRLIVGTPGRINDHLQSHHLTLEDTNFLVLDETDRMLDMGFSVQVERILRYMPAQRQTLLFSATLPKHIVRISEKYLSNPARICVSPPSSPAANIKQDLLRINQDDKYFHLLTQIEDREGSIIIFLKTKYGTEKMAAKLSKEGHSANAIHGDLRQNKRDRVIAAFRDKKYRILVATDVAARGLDIPHIEHVINYDLPQCPEDYIHRIGRTARAGAEGSALNFITPEDKSKWNAIDRLLNPRSKGDDEPRQASGKQRRFLGKRSERRTSASGTPAFRNGPKRYKRSHSRRKTAA